MALVPLTNDQTDQFVLHINELRTIVQTPPEDGGYDSAAAVANKCVALYEQLAANLPGGITGFDCGITEGDNLSVPEAAALRGRINALAAVITGDENSFDIANEMLGLFEERVLAVGQTTGRDVTETQLP